MAAVVVIVLGVVIGCGAPPSPPVRPPRPTLSPALASDLALLRRALDELHPGLHRYLTVGELDRAFADAADALAVATTPGQRVLVFTRLTASLACGHTQVNPFNQSDATLAAVYQGPRLPFAFRWLDRRMVITRAFVDDPALAPGTTVAAINGVATATVLERLLPLGRADGANQAKRIASLEVHGLDRYEAFDVLAPLVVPALAPPYQLALVDLDGTRRDHTVAAMTYAARLAAQPADPSDAADAPLWQLAWLDTTTAYLRMPTWVAYRTTWDWRADLDRIVTEVAARVGARFIVDLRGNEGGSDVGDRILAHLIDAPIPARTTERWVRYRAVTPELRPALDTWDPAFFDWGADAVPSTEPGWFTLRDDPGAETIAPIAPRFRGRVVVLVDATNSSATFQFAAQVQARGLATLVGEPTGGNRRGINGGAFFFLRLPGSDIEIDLPLIGTYPPGRVVDGVPDGGVMPDLVVRTTADDLARGRDPQLAAARALR